MPKKPLQQTLGLQAPRQDLLSQLVDFVIHERSHSAQRQRPAVAKSIAKRRF